MKLSTRGRDFIKAEEGFSSSVYYDSNGVPHIGYGFNLDVHNLPEQMTRDQADAIFEELVIPYETRVSQALERNVSQCQYDALVSHHYNTGVISEGLYERVNTNAPDLLTWWVNHYTTPNLEARRKREAALYAANCGNITPWILLAVTLGGLSLFVYFNS